jgi:CheY-like chemotaxis protein
MTLKNRILIVDDDPLNVNLLEAMLPEEKYIILRAYDGSEALEKAAEQHPDLILLDIMMPELSGYQVTRKLKDDPDTRHIPIVLVTALHGVEDKIKGLEMGADDFLSKPLDKTELTARVNSLLKVKAYHDHLLNYQKELEAEVARRTEKLELEFMKRQEAESQLIQAQKMEAIGTLAGGIAHDFNNILSAIMGYIELALLDVGESTDLNRYLQQVLIAVNRAKGLVDQILTFSRQAERELKPVKLKPILKEVFKMLRALLPATIEMQQDISSESLVLADPTQIHQLIINLCTNAAHAMDDKGGTLEVKLSDVQLGASATDRQPGLRPGKFIELTVSDTGHGMTPEVMGRIFDPFFTTKEKGKGTGIGLSAVHGIIKSHGGGITVTSEPDSGSIFRVLLPVIEKEVAENNLDQAKILTGNECILFIDDEPMIANVGKLLLERLGYCVETCTGSLEALEQFRAQPDKFDLIVCDLNMPKMTGKELAAKFREIRSEIPIILCTGYSADDYELKDKKLGINAVVLKPMAMAETAKVIQKVLGKN